MILPVIILLFVSCSTQVQSLDSCDDEECFLKETFENCEHLNDCLNNTSNAESLTEYYEYSFEVRISKAIDIQLSAYNKIKTEFIKQVNNGPKNCQSILNEISYSYLKEDNCNKAYDNKYDNEWEEAQYSDGQDNKVYCTLFQNYIKEECNTRKMTLDDYNKCNVSEIFERALWKPWRKCVDSDKF